MTNLIKVLLYMHITSGFTALMSGFFAIVSKKGQKKHRLAGLIYFYSMLGVAITAFAISILKSNQFLLHISIFAFFQTFNGYKSVKAKDLKAEPIDWLVFVLGLVNTIFMMSSNNLILMVFGGISIFLIYGTFKIYYKNIKNQELPKMLWLTRHIGMMIGAYIATTTAFVVVNIKSFEPSWLPWLAPTFIGVPLIAYFTNKYRPKKTST